MTAGFHASRAHPARESRTKPASREFPQPWCRPKRPADDFRVRCDNGGRVAAWDHVWRFEAKRCEDGAGRNDGAAADLVVRRDHAGGDCVDPGYLHPSATLELERGLLSACLCVTSAEHLRATEASTEPGDPGCHSRGADRSFAGGIAAYETPAIPAVSAAVNSVMRTPATGSGTCQFAHGAEPQGRASASLRTSRRSARVG
jgi:hypothetical protein